MPAPFDLPYFQRALVEVLVLSVGAGLLGTWIVLRGMAFYAHAVGTAAFPGLVLADGLGFAAPLGALGAALVFAVATALLVRARAGGGDTVTALTLVAMLAVGVILASDVFASSARVESLLFGSLLAVEGRDIAIAAVASAAAVAATVTLGRAWLAAGFDRSSARALGLRSPLPDALLFLLVAVVAIAALSAVGALLVSALLVIPAATARIWTDRLGAWQAASVGLAAVEGTFGLWLSVELNAPPGATIATLAGVVFALAALARALGPRRAVRAAAVLASCVALTALASCGGDDETGASVDVLATTTLIADWAREVGGDELEVRALLRPGTDPHDYEPRPEDVESVAGASVLLTSGRGYDGWAGEIVDAAGGDAEVVDLSERASTLRTDGEDDPHWWHDPTNAIRAVGLIREALERAAPESADSFERNAARYTSRLRRLDAAVESCFARVPPERRKLVTDHDAFSYLARRYEVEVIGAVIPARTSQAQPSARDVSKLAEVIRSEKVEAVFPERETSGRVARAIARETGADVGKELYAESLDDPGSRAGTYVGMVAANADALVRGLSGGAERCSPTSR